MRLAWIALALLSACSVENIVAGRDRSGTTGSNNPQDSGMSEDAGSADAGASGSPCRLNSDCASNEYCEIVGCGPREGRCSNRPNVCDSRAAPVCGCDNVTYFNDCIRKQTSGAAVREFSYCAFGAKPCGGSGGGGAGGRPCSPGEFCAQLVPDRAPLPCPSNAPGTCWVMPTVCDPAAGGMRFNACDGAPLMCMDACTAIRSRHPHVVAKNECPAP